ncbi:MAG: hypothetical protein JNK12_16935 [Acidimicrobiales bacterium]|nr:hypothetical protein [Acidimicrobiales bacterium]
MDELDVTTSSALPAGSRDGAQDAHDLGLRYDLTVLAARRAEVMAARLSDAPRLLHRRGALKLLGGAGLGLVLAACGSSSSSSSASSTSAAAGGSTTSSALGAASTTAGGSSSAAGTVTDAVPEETAGPYPADGTNGPDVLTESGIVREDITTSFGDYSGTAEGLPLGVDLTVVHAGDGSPFPGAALYLWHADRDGRYSLYTATDQNYLRGVQVAGDDGTLSFTTIFPGCYDGRWPHMHFEVYPSVGDITSNGNRLVTSQLALPEDISSEVYGSADGYESSVSNLSRTSLATDMVFSDGADLQTPTVTGTPAAGDLRIALTVAVNA